MVAKPTANSGFSYLLRGFALLKEPGIRLFVAIPLLVNIAIFSALIALTLGQFGQWLEALLAWLPSWLDFLRWILWPLMVILLLAMVMYLFSTVANLIAAPFNGLLAEKVEELVSGREVVARETIWQALRSFPRSIGRELKKLLYFAALALTAFLASLLIPPLAPAAPLLSFAVGAWLMAIEYCDYAMDNHGLSFKEARRRVMSQRGTAAGFGALVMAGTMVPILNLVIMPAAVCGGTLLWVERLNTQNAGRETGDAKGGRKSEV